MVCWAYRYADYRFPGVALSASEEAAVAHLAPNVGAFLAWRRTLLAPCAALLCFSVLIQVLLTIRTYSVGAPAFLADLIGPQLWSGVFCPDPPCRSVVVALHGVYASALATGVLLILVAVGACVLTVRAALQWATYAQTSALLRRAYSAIFFAPFALFVLLPPAQFLNLPALQSALCVDRIHALVPISTTSGLPKDICSQPIGTWAQTLQSTLITQGSLLNRTTGSCPRAEAVIDTAAAYYAQMGAEAPPCRDESLMTCRNLARMHFCAIVDETKRQQVLTACPLACGICSAQPACRDWNSAFALANNPMGLHSCNQAVSAGLCNETAIQQSCPLGCGICTPPCEDDDMAVALFGNPDFTTCADALAQGACNALPLLQRHQVRQMCPRSCEQCDEVGTNRRGLQRAAGSLADLANRAGAENAGSLLRLDGCVDPFAVHSVQALQVSLSDEVLVGAVALRRSSSVLVALLPAALGLALGAGQGTTLAKSLLLSSRMPAMLATTIVFVTLPCVAALLAVINQLLASGWGTLACVSALITMTVWVPWREPVRGCDYCSDSSAILRPAGQSAVIWAITRRKWMVTFWMALTVLFICLFLSFSTAASMVTDQLQQTVQALSIAYSRGESSGEWGMLILFVLPIVQTVLETIAKTYLSQVFYTDQAVVGFTYVWHADQQDSADDQEGRAEQFHGVAIALGLSNRSANTPHARSARSSLPSMRATANSSGPDLLRAAPPPSGIRSGSKRSSGKMMLHEVAMTREL